MKKVFTTVPALCLTVSILISGCSLPSKEVTEATEYVGDEASLEISEEDASSTEKSIVVIDNLFEPILETASTSEVSAAASTEETQKTEEKNSDKTVNIVFFGDSQLANGRDDGTDIPHLIGARVPNSRIYNMAIGGTTATVEKSTNNVSSDSLQSTSFLGMAYCFAEKSDRWGTLSDYPQILDTMNSIDPKDVDYYVLSYGTNDFFNNVPLDVDYSSSENDRAHALFNAYNMGLEVLKSISPDAHIVIITPFYGIYVDDNGAYIGDSYVVSNGMGTLSEYADKIKNVAEDKDIVVFDGMYGSRFDLYLDTASQYLMDNLHLTLTGRQIVARLLAHEFNFREGNEPYAYLETDFIKIADFDPDEYYRYDEHQMKQYFPESWEKYIRGEFPLAQPSEEAVEAYKNEQSGG